MKPDIDLQLQVVMKSLQDVITPAIDPENKPANEQIHLCLHMLSIVRDRLPYQRRFVRGELRDCINYLQEVNELIDAAHYNIKELVVTAISSGQKTLGDVEIDTPDLVEKVSELKTLTSHILLELVNSENYRQIEVLGLALTENQLNKARAWFITCGVEANADSLPNLNDVT